MNALTNWFRGTATRVPILTLLAICGAGTLNSMAPSAGEGSSVGVAKAEIDATRIVTTEVDATTIGTTGVGTEDIGTILPVDPLTRQVDGYLAPWDHRDSPGAAVLVLRDGEVLHAKGYGMASLERGTAITTRSVFDVASVAKQFTAFAVALLESEGKLSVDDDVRAHLPELPDFGRTITIRHLLDHTSGLRDWPGALLLAGWDFEEALSLDRILQMAFAQSRLNFEPGSEQVYSNTGYNLLAEIVARISGQSFREFSQKRIFDPLGMHHTHVHDDDAEVVPDRVDSYRPDRRGGHRRIPSHLTAAGSSSLFTTAEDLALWIRHLEKPADWARDAVRRMDQRGTLNSGVALQDGWGQQSALLGGLRAVSHGGAWAGYRSMVLRFPDQRFSVVVLANTEDLDAVTLASWIAQAHLDEEMSHPDRPARGRGDAPLPGPEIVVPAWTPSDSELDAYAGEYRSSELNASYRIDRVEDGLVAHHVRRGAQPLRPLAPDLFGAPAMGELRFLRDGPGHVTGFTVEQTRNRGLQFDRLSP